MGFANARFIGSILCHDSLCRKVSYVHLYIYIYIDAAGGASLVVRMEYRDQTKHVAVFHL